MQRYAFSIEVGGLEQTLDYEDALFQAGCDDALVLKSDGRLLVDFEREGPSFDHAVASARQAILHAGGWVVRVILVGSQVAATRGGA